MKTKWRILIDGNHGPAENMAIDEAIFSLVARGESVPTIRFYGWEPPTLSIGYHQKSASEADFDVLSELGYGFVRRPTGGRAVLHKDEVTYAVIAPLGGSLDGNVTDIYVRISEALRDGLRLMGVNVELEKGKLSTEDQRKAANPCFTSTSRYELAVEGRKIVGSAQVRRDGAFLQHGSILLHHDQSEIADLLPDLSDGVRNRVRKFLEKQTISIDKAIGLRISDKTAIANLAEGFRGNWVECDFFEISSIKPEERVLALELANSKYEKTEWNRRI